MSTPEETVNEQSLVHHPYFVALRAGEAANQLAGLEEYRKSADMLVSELTSLPLEAFVVVKLQNAEQQPTLDEHLSILHKAIGGQRVRDEEHNCISYQFPRQGLDFSIRSLGKYRESQLRIKAPRPVSLGGEYLKITVPIGRADVKISAQVPAESLGEDQPITES